MGFKESTTGMYLSCPDSWNQEACFFWYLGNVTTCKESSGEERWKQSEIKLWTLSNIFTVPKSHCLSLWSGIQKIFQKSQTYCQCFQISAGIFNVRVTCRAYSASLFADKELWTNSLVSTDNILTSVCKWFIIILLIFSSRLFAWKLLMQQYLQITVKMSLWSLLRVPSFPKTDSHVAHANDHWKNKQPIGSHCQKVDGLFFPVALNDILAISRYLSYKLELDKAVVFLWGWGSVWIESCSCHPA